MLKFQTRDSTMIEEFAWVFNGSGGRFPGGIFSSRELAESWIAKHGLSGVLTRYPLDIGAFDWAVSKNLFRPIREDQTGLNFIGSFSSASFEHYHYEDGVCLNV